MRSEVMLVWSFVLLGPTLGGCLGAGSWDAGVEPKEADPGLEIAALGFVLDVPVDVYLLGFDEGLDEALAGRLTPEMVRPVTYNAQNSLLDLEHYVETNAYHEQPFALRARYRVHALPAAASDAVLRTLAARPVDSELPDVFDANLAEELVTDALAVDGHALDAARPAIAVLHAGAVLPDGHAWRYTLPHGYLEPVRAFGQRVPVVLFDASARSDPYALGERSGVGPGTLFEKVADPRAVKGYNHPMQPGGETTTRLLEELVRDATHHRLLQGPVYPISTRPCHAVTVLLAIDQTSLTEALPDHRRAHDWLDAEALSSSFSALTGESVAVNVRTLLLPQDEPELGALLRGSTSTLAIWALRTYVDENWRAFVEAADPCEEVLALFYHADAVQQVVTGPAGIGYYDEASGRRLALAWVSDVRRIRDEYRGPGEDVVSTDDPSREPNWLNDLVAHETGHVLGQMHPQHVLEAGRDGLANDAFQSGWSVMAYQTGDRVIEFGAVDRANWLRNRAAFAVVGAQERGLEGTAAYERALQALVAHDWVGVQEALEAQLSTREV